MFLQSLKLVHTNYCDNDLLSLRRLIQNCISSDLDTFVCRDVEQHLVVSDIIFVMNIVLSMSIQCVEIGYYALMQYVTAITV